MLSNAIIAQSDLYFIQPSSSRQHSLCTGNDRAERAASRAWRIVDVSDFLRYSNL